MMSGDVEDVVQNNSGKHLTMRGQDDGALGNGGQFLTIAIGDVDRFWKGFKLQEDGRVARHVLGGSRVDVPSGRRTIVVPGGGSMTGSEGYIPG